jgi:transposase
MKRVVKVYPLEFKLESVRRYLKNNRSLNETAKELGIPLSTLKGWQVKYMNEIKKTQSDKPSKKTLEDSLKEKEKRIKELEEENLILKKSIGIFTRNPQQK